MALSLREFAGRIPAGRYCKICALPERAEIEAAYGERVGQKTIVAWLEQEMGYERGVITVDKLNYHFNRMRHHEGDESA